MLVGVTSQYCVSGSGSGCRVEYGCWFEIFGSLFKSEKVVMVGVKIGLRSRWFGWCEFSQLTLIVVVFELARCHDG